MNRNVRMAAALLFVIVGTAATLASKEPAARQTGKESFTGFAINMNAGPNTATVDFTIERWSTDAQRAQLLGIVKQERDAYEANRQLLKALTSLPVVGTIRTQRTLAWDLHYARQSPLEDGGRRLVLATDRPVGLNEPMRQARTMEYPFTIVEIHLDTNNRGEGKILVATKLFIDKNNNLVLENYANEPVAFNDIKPLK